jgi:hypothetical protein
MLSLLSGRASLPSADAASRWSNSVTNFLKPFSMSSARGIQRLNLMEARPCQAHSYSKSAGGKDSGG